MWTATFLSLISCYGLMSVECASWETMKSLKEHLLTNYSKDIRPIRNQSDAVIVECNMHLTDIVDLDEVRQILTILTFFTFRWTDEFLIWNSSDYGGISSIQLDQDRVWIPWINLYRIVDISNLFGDVRFRLTARSDGQITWNPIKKISVTCIMDVSLFPFDSQHCTLAFTPLMYGTEEVKLINVEKSVNSLVLKTHGEWVFGASNYSFLDYKLDVITVSVLHVQMEFKRRSLFFVQNFLFPIIILSFLNLLTFWLPDGSGEKASFSITVLLALTFYLTSVSGYLPQNSVKPVYITMYISCLLMLSCLTVLASLVLIRCHHKHLDVPQPTDNNQNVSNDRQKDNSEKNTDKIKTGSKRRISVDKTLFLVFFITWMSVTLWFFVSLILKQ